MEKYMLPTLSVILLLIIILIFREKRKLIRKSIKSQIVLSFLILIMIILMHIFYENKEDFMVSKILLGIVLILNVFKIYRKIKIENNLT
jgi:Mn2+/Fe2+ NRAMP family transporter